MKALPESPLLRNKSSHVKTKIERGHHRARQKEKLKGSGRPIKSDPILSPL